MPQASVQTDAINLKKYTKLGVIGRGGFGKVLHVKYRCGRSKPKKIRSRLLWKRCQKLSTLLFILSSIQKKRGVCNERITSFKMFERLVSH